MKTNPKPATTCAGLREAGFAVDLATTGPDGLHLALHTAPDLVILDVMLPRHGRLAGVAAHPLGRAGNARAVF